MVKAASKSKAIAVPRTKTVAYDVAEQLRTPGQMAAYLDAWLQEAPEDAAGIARALGDIARAKGMSQVARDATATNSVASAVAVAGSLGVSMVTVHASGGSAVLRAAVTAAQPFPHLQVLALTVITSMGEQDLAEVGVHGSVLEQVERLAVLAAAAGCHGVVASAHEATRLRQLLPAGMLIVTPGTQLTGEARTDQTRTATPSQAIRAGATHLIIGRSIAQAANPVATFTSICDEVAEAVAHPHP